MKLFSSLKNQATLFLEQYKEKGPATYAAAQQAIGTILIIDGFFGIDGPFGAKKRPGIIGAFTGIFFGVLFMFIPSFIGNLSGMKDMTATTSAIVVSVGDQVSDGDSQTCSLTASFTVNGQNYTKKSSTSASDHCSLSTGDSITINYNPANPNAWVYGLKTIKSFMLIFFLAGLAIAVSSVFTFIIRLLSIIFGWKLLRTGRKNASSLPPGTNLQSIIEELKRNFKASIFGFGTTQAEPTMTTKETTNTETIQ